MKRAEKAYAKAMADSRKLMGFISDQLDMHDKNACAEGINYGHVGDIRHIREELMKQICFLLGNDDETEGLEIVEAAL